MIGFYDYTVILTYASLVSSLGGIFLAIGGHPMKATCLLLLSGLFDMFDGKVARTKKDRTCDERHFGIEIDSLNDVISFGVLPSVIAYTLGCKSAWQVFILILFTLCGLIRLAYYNVTEYSRQKEEKGTRYEYCGLPITSSSIAVPVVYLIYHIFSLTDNVMCVIMSCMMLLCAVAFISPIKVKKPKGRAAIFLVVIGLVTAALLAVSVIEKM